MVKTGEFSALAGMWLSSMILTPIGIFLTYKATTDSVLLDTEFYSKIVGKLIRFKAVKRFISSNGE